MQVNVDLHLMGKGSLTAASYCNELQHVYVKICAWTFLWMITGITNGT